MQLHLTGGEPLLAPRPRGAGRAARARELYINLITSGVPLDRERLAALARRGLDHVQLSSRRATPARATRIAGADGVRAQAGGRRLGDGGSGLPLTLNVVLHRANIDARCRDRRARRGASAPIGWSWPTRSTSAGRSPIATRSCRRARSSTRARASAAAARQRLAGKMEMLFVLPDYFAGRPRACMERLGAPLRGGRARRAACCPATRRTRSPGLAWERVGERSLAEIWRDSPALERSAARRGCRSRAASCDGASATSAAAAARRSSSPATPEPPIPRAPRRPVIPSSKRCGNPSHLLASLHIAVYASITR